MSRIVTTSKTVYTFDELADSAKETAREEWNRFLWDDGSAQESMELLFNHIMEEAGWENAELVSYSLYSQGGYPTFRGTLPAFVHDGRTYVLTVTHRNAGGSSAYMECDIEDPDESDDDAYGSPGWDAYSARITAAREAAEELVSDMSHTLYRAFEDEDEYQSSEESVRDAAEANGYEYDEDGHLA